MIPIQLNERVSGGLSGNEDISSLMFINRKGETVIPANTNWKSPFYDLEIYQNGVPTGIKLTGLRCADEHTIIAYESVDLISEFGYPYRGKGRLMMYHIY